MPRPAWAGLDLPTAAGGVTLAALPDAPMLGLGVLRAGTAALEQALGAAPPPPGRFAALEGGARLIWAGLDQWWLRGTAATSPLGARLAECAAVSDQSDGWTGLAVTGGAAGEALARLVPVDLAPTAFPPGSVARSELRHVPALILARADGDGFEVFAPRSLTGAAVHEIGSAIRALAARAALD